MGKMSEVTSFKDSMPRFLLNHSNAVAAMKNTYLPIENTSPVHRPNVKLPKALAGKKLKHLSCPVQPASKRLLYECPKCHRFRNFMDDRDQFILYGVTRLWPTPPPAPQTFSSPNVGDSKSADNLEGTYNICRIFHTSGAKLHPRSSQKKIKVIIPNTGFIETDAAINKPRPRRKIRHAIISKTSPGSNNINNTNADLENMVDLLRRHLTPRDNFILKGTRSSSSNFVNIATEKTTTSKTDNATKISTPTQKAVDMQKPASSKTQATLVCNNRVTITDCKSVNMTSSYTTVLSRSNPFQVLSPKKLESWTKRLRNGVYIKMAENGRSQTKQISGNSSVRKKKNLKRKTTPIKGTGYMTKSSDASQTNSVVSPKLEVCETPGGRESVATKSEKSSPSAGVWAVEGERMLDTVVSSSRTQSLKKKKQRVRCKKRARSFSTRHSSASGETQDETKICSKVTTHIEAVKISEERAITPKKEKRRSKRLGTKKSTGSVNLLEKNRSTEAPKVSEDEKTESVISSLLPYCPKEADDPVSFLDDFKNKMKQCQGKGYIKTSHIEVIAYLEGKKSDTSVQAVPKTYQQMGLAPLKRSESSENCTKFLSFKCALSDTNIVPKIALTGHSAKRRKKKRKKCKSTPNSPRRKVDGEIALKMTDETKSVSRQVKKSASLGRQRPQCQRAQQQNTAIATASSAVLFTSASAK